MPDTKITALTAIGANPIIPATFPIPMVDLTDTTMAASGTTKKVTVNQILGAGGTATLASATITGDLTVDTSTLKVDSTNNRVGIGTASPLYPLHLVGEFGLEEASPAGTGSKLRFIGDATKYNFRIGKQLNVNNGFEITPSTALGGTTFSNPVYTVTNDGIHTFLDGAGGTRMTLNSTGLGVGGAPITNNTLSIYGAAFNDTDAFYNTTFRNSVTAATSSPKQGITFSGLWNANAYATFAGVFGGKENATSGNYAGSLAFWTLPNGGNATTRMLIDSTGNVGIGVTPSAWVAAVKGLQVGAYGAIGGSSSNFNLYGNLYSSAGGTAYLGNGYGTLLQMTNGQYVFYQAGNNTSGAGALVTPSLTQSMTLDASGRLMVGKTSSSTASTGAELQTGAGGNSASVFTADGAFASIMNRLTSDGIVVDLRRQTTSVGNITVTTTGATFNSTSDYRLKEAVAPLSGGLARVSALKPSVYKWKADGSAGEGFLAHELAEVVPAAVTGEKDAVNEDGSIKSQSIDMSRVVPILVAAIQELAARVQTLETR